MIVNHCDIDKYGLQQEKMAGKGGKKQTPSSQRSWPASVIFSCSLMFNSTFFTLRCIIHKICIKENLKLRFFLKNATNMKSLRLKVSVAWRFKKKKKKEKERNVAPKISLRESPGSRRDSWAQ